MREYKKNLGIRVEEASWEEIADFLYLHPLGVLPIAASSKEHGMHLPMSTDSIQAHKITEQLLLTHRLIVWPTISYGYYPAFINYAGSISVTNETFARFVAEVCQSIFSHGVPHLVLLNTGISTIPPLKTLVNKHEFKGKLHLLNIYEGRQFRATEQHVSQQSIGGHADEIETSIMLAIAQEQVDMNKAEAGLRDSMTSGALQKDTPQLDNYSKSGVIGDPSLATREKGEQLINAIMQDIEDFITNLTNQ